MGVLVATAYCVLVQQQPKVQLRGILGLIGLVVNATAAIVLVPTGRAMPTCGRCGCSAATDAIGNVAVVIAALLVAWTQTPWPDLVVAVVIAGLFLQSALSIIKDARNDLRLAARASRAA